jgi:hypothetical protein
MISGVKTGDESQRGAPPMNCALRADVSLAIVAAPPAFPIFETTAIAATDTTTIHTTTNANLLKAPLGNLFKASLLIDAYMTN